MGYNSSMSSLPESSKEYFKELKRRGTKSKIYASYQLTGLEIANILEDQAHKALYIRLAKQYGDQTMMHIAKSVAEKKDVRNKGAYFMRMLKGKKKPAK
jgi:hypothetical protein